MEYNFPMMNLQPPPPPPYRCLLPQFSPLEGLPQASVLVDGSPPDSSPPPESQQIDVDGADGDFDIEELIDLVKDRPAIWNPAFKSHKDVNVLRNCWAEISSIVNVDGKCGIFTILD